MSSSFWKLGRNSILVLLFLLITALPYRTLAGNNPITNLLEWPARIQHVKQDALTLKASLPRYPLLIQTPDNQTIYSWIEGISATPHRRPGTPEGHRAEAWVKERFQEIGLQNVTEERISIPVWTPQRWSLAVAGQEIPSYFTLNSGFTGSMGVTAPLVYVGKGSSADFNRVDASGKIAVVDADIAAIPKTDLNHTFFVSDPLHQLTNKVYAVQYPSNMLGAFVPGFDAKQNKSWLEKFLEQRDTYRNAVSHKAVGLIMILKGYCSGYNSFYGPYDGTMKSLPGLYVGKYEGENLRELAKQGKKAKLLLEGTLTEGYMANIWGTLPGQSQKVIMVTSHHDSPHQGAVEDGSGIAQVLAQSWAWSRVPEEKRPKTLVFVAAAGHFFRGQGAYHFGQAHPEILDRTDALITLEHMGAKEVKEGTDGRYVSTGRPQASTINSSLDAKVVAPVWKAFDTSPQPATISTNPLFDFPLTDAAGYIVSTRERNYKRKEGVRYVSWISAPCYLIDEGDTLDKIDQSRLQSISATVTKIIQNFMTEAGI